jgi:hypothetical protein
VCSYLDGSELAVFGFVHHSHATTAKLFKDFIMGYSFANHSVGRINEREFGKISEKDLTVKDFQKNRSIVRALPESYGTSTSIIILQV